MRTLTDHIVARDASRQLTIEVVDQPGAGGANLQERTKERIAHGVEGRSQK